VRKERGPRWNKTMSINRKCIRLTVEVLVLLTVLPMSLPAFAQGLEEAMLFAPADVSAFGSGIQPAEGYFFVFDGLHWSISAPGVAVIGKPNYVRQDVYRSDPTQLPQPFDQSSTHDTGDLTSAFTDGNRIEFGRVWGHKGWMFSGYSLQNQTQQIVASSVDVAFEDFDIATGFKALDGLVENLDPTAPPSTDPNDPTAGATLTEFRSLPVTFDEMSFKNSVETWSAEFMCMHRFRQTHHGSVFELFAGARFLEFDESFDVNGIGHEIDETTTTTTTTTTAAPAGEDLPPVPPILANSTWNTAADNHIIGPQVGARYFRKWNRWMFSTEGRFLAGFNFQNVRQNGILGSELSPPGVSGQPYLQSPIDINHNATFEEWSPLIECRVEARYQFSRSVSFRVGWTGFWVDGIARPSDMVVYEINRRDTRPNPLDFESMGILADNNRQSVFVHGWTVGLDINR